MSLARPLRSAVRTGAALVSLALGLTSCALTGSSVGGSQDTLTVFAAASLTETFTALGAEFEAAHPGTRVTFTFGGSADLVSQISNGAPADVFAAADTATMARLRDDGLAATTPEPFATNTLRIVVPADNPARVAGLSDLSSSDLDLVICAPQVPCGAAAATVAAAAGVALSPVSEEQSVKDVLAKVVLGQADAGLVYLTDARAAGTEVRVIGFPESSAAVNTYPITTVVGTDHGDLAAAFLALVRGPAGQRVLRQAGFGAP